MSSDIESCIRNNVAWSKLSKNAKQLLGNSQREYEKMIVEFSVKNQLRYKLNLVRTVRKNEEQYYELLMQHSRTHLMLFPYHLCDIIVRELRTTPFQYYIDMMQDLMTQERSYDSLPNFTAADCLRLLGIGRNQYIDLMNQCRSTKKLFRRRPVRELLPAHPIELAVEPWWMIQVGSVMEDDVKPQRKGPILQASGQSEKDVIDILIDEGAQLAGTLDQSVIQKLYNRGLVYFDVPVHDNDCIIVPPLDGFVMNRVLGDYFETLLYKIFVTIDEHTNVGELASILQIDEQLVRNAVSLFCRLGFARKRLTGLEHMALHVTWAKHMRFEDEVAEICDKWSIDLDTDLATTPAGDAKIIGDDEDSCSTSATVAAAETPLPLPLDVHELTGRRLGFLFDSTLTAFLMMGNLSTSLKTHAVTLFEVGKLADEALDNFVEELKKVRSFGEGEAQQYFEHAQTLRLTIETLRESHELDLLRCESLSALDAHARSRLLTKNYQLLISMAPLSPEVQPISSAKPAHLGPPIAEVNSPWWRLFLYDTLGTGPTSLLLAKGTRQSRIPDALRCHSRQLLLGTWTHEPATVQADHCLGTLNDTLVNSSVLLQSYADEQGLEIVHIPFPLVKDEDEPSAAVGQSQTHGLLSRHPHVLQLNQVLQLHSACGYATMVRTRHDPDVSPSSCLSGGSPGPMQLDLSAVQAAALNPNAVVNKDPRRCPSHELAASRDDHTFAQWTLFDFVFGLPLFDTRLSQRVCQQINKTQLFALSRREDVEEMNCNISIALLDFIKRFQPVFDDSMDDLTTHRVPYPLTNLIFEDGKVSLFDDR